MAKKQQPDDAFEAAVQAEVAKRMAAQQQAFAQMMQQTIQSGLKGIDEANVALKKQHHKLEKARDAADQQRIKAEKEGEKIAEDYFQKSRTALQESARQTLLRDLAYRHLQAGQPAEDICRWLDVSPEFVQHLIDLMDRRVNYRREVWEKNRMPVPENARLTYRDSGRSGTIWFENDHTRFDMWWEFGGGNALVIIDIPSTHQWEARTNLPPEQRDTILRFIAEQVIADQTTSAHDYEIGESAITIFRT